MKEKARKSTKLAAGYLSYLIVSLAVTLMITTTPSFSAEVYYFTNNWGQAGFNLTTQNTSAVEVVFSVPQLEVREIDINGEQMQNVIIPGIYLPRNAGAPNLPGGGRYIAIPEGSTVKVEMVDCRTEIFHNMNIAPSFVIPRGDYDGPLVYRKNPEIYSTDANYPTEPVMVSEIREIRGVDVVILGITPFQYNPVTKDLIVYKDIRVRVSFIGGFGYFGEDRLRSRWWEPVLKQNLMNYASLPEMDFSRAGLTDEDDVEYIIIVPDEPEFLAWADTLKRWRNEQGIITGITTLTEIGGNDETLIENYINDAYRNWDPAPVAVLLLSDYQGTGDHYGITSPTFQGVLSDNKYADVNGDDLPDLIIGRICAQNEQHLSTMINKMLSYEREPYTDPTFYDDPLIAGGWESDRWFILCCEIIRGYFIDVHGKRPEIQYSGTSSPPSVWSTNGNTYMVVDYFGPRGLDYIPQTPSYLNNWNGNAEGINNAINNGVFLVQHRDHGSPTSWGSPVYNISNINQLTNTMYPYVFSINCSTGKYNYSSTCFAEAFHRSPYGALGVNAASGSSYSFVNDTFVWGMYDSMWQDFDPFYPETGTDPTGEDNQRPGAANASGKYYLEASVWPEPTTAKTITYHLFHHHGDAFMTLYSEVPQELTAVHDDVLIGGVEEFTVTADEGSLIGLSVDGDYIGSAEGTGNPVLIDITPQTPGSVMLVTVTKSNYFRYMEEVIIVPPSGPHVIASEVEVADARGWNPNGQLDYDETSKLTLTVLNIGVEEIEDVVVTISTEDSLLTIIDNTEYYGTVSAGSTATVSEGYEVIASPCTPDEHYFYIEVSASSDTLEWESGFEIYGHAPVLVFNRLDFDDSSGNNNGWLDPGETADMDVFLTNEGSAPGQSMEGTLASLDPMLTINTAVSSYENMEPGETISATFNVTADLAAPQEYLADVNMVLTGDHDFNSDLDFQIMIGNVLYDPSGPDNYGYFAYDPFDSPENPVYEWVEICADSGGPGTLVNFTHDEEVFHYELPFTFQYYGVQYDTFTVATNGWIAMGQVEQDDYSNSGIPNTDGPPNMIASYWEDLSPQRPNSGKVWFWYDEAENRLIVEYNHIEQYSPTGAFETFQMILLDPAYHPTLSGDGRIIFQYKDMSMTALTSEGTVGIENASQTDGIEYYYEGDYDFNAHSIENEFVILFSTLVTAPDLEITLTPSGTPIRIPAIGGEFDFDLAIENNGETNVDFDAWIDVTLPGGSNFGPLILREGLSMNPGGSLLRAMTQEVPGSAPAGEYIYYGKVGMHPNVIFSTDSFTFEKLGVDIENSAYYIWQTTGWDNPVGETENAAVIPGEFALHQNYPNPFNPSTTIRFDLPEAGQVKLVVYNVNGQEMARLVEGYRSAGMHEVVFDAKDLTSGVYFVRLEAGEFKQTSSLTRSRFVSPTNVATNSSAG